MDAWPRRKRTGRIGVWRTVALAKPGRGCLKAESAHRRGHQQVTHALGLGFTVFAVIFLLELPDKTALAALLLSTRHRPPPVFLGAGGPFVVQSAVARLSA